MSTFMYRVQKFFKERLKVNDSSAFIANPAYTCPIHQHCIYTYLYMYIFNMANNLAIKTISTRQNVKRLSDYIYY